MDKFKSIVACSLAVAIASDSIVTIKKFLPQPACITTINIVSGDSPSPQEWLGTAGLLHLRFLACIRHDKFTASGLTNNRLQPPNGNKILPQ
jgi:hypothetical protein